MYTNIVGCNNSCVQYYDFHKTIGQAVPETHVFINKDRDGI